MGLLNIQVAIYQKLRSNPKTRIASAVIFHFSKREGTFDFSKTQKSDTSAKLGAGGRMGQ